MTRTPSKHKIAVIDIGSNSVRLVVFEGAGRFPAVEFNEKVMCGLGRGLATGKRLHPEGMVSALQTLERFALLLQEMKVTDIRAVATAAVRDADNGKPFLEAVETRCKFKVTLLSGSEEARTSAMGVIAGIPEADGLVGDLGGGSLELIRVGGGQVGDNVTLPLGPFLLQDDYKKSRAATVARIADTLSQVSWLKDGKGKDFYAVGGAWRALARLHLERNSYPLHILHYYEMSRAQVLDFCTALSGMSAQSLAKVPRTPQRRIESLPIAAAVLRKIFELSGARRLVVSALGLREGLVYSAMPEAVRKADPLLDACRELAEHSGRFPEHSEKLLRWIDPLFTAETPAERRLRLAACMLADVAWRGHPDYRAEKVLSEVVFGRFGGLDHRGTALLALALYICYGGNLGEGLSASLLRLLTEEEVARAQLVGLSLRLGQRLSGGTSSALAYASLELTQDALYLKVRESHQAVAGEVVARRLETLAKAMGRKAAVVPA